MKNEATGAESMDPRPEVSAATGAEAAALQAQLRQQSRASRRERAPTERDDAAVAIADRTLALPAVSAARCVTAYRSLEGEPPTDELLQRLSAGGIRQVLLPRIAPRRQLEWVPWQPGAETAPGPWGIEEPIGPGVPLTDAEVLLIPAALVDARTGVRIGQGGGYYDRALNGLGRRRDGGPLRVAIVFDDEVRVGLPRQDWDQTVDVIVTPHRTIPVTSR